MDYSVSAVASVNMSLRIAVVGCWFMIVLCSLASAEIVAQEHKAEAAPAASAETAAQAEVSQPHEVHAVGQATDEHTKGGGHNQGQGGHGESVLPPDLTHSNMSPQALALVDFRTDKAMFTVVVFLLLLAILYATAWKPIMQGLEKRERGISDNISRAEKAAAEATAKLAGYEAKLASAAEEAQKLVATARKDAESAGQRILAAAQEEAARQRDRAVAEIESAKRTALNELASKSTDIAMSLAQRIVGRELRADDHQKLVQDMLSKLPSRN